MAGLKALWVAVLLLVVHERGAKRALGRTCAGSEGKKSQRGIEGQRGVQILRKTDASVITGKQAREGYKGRRHIRSQDGSSARTGRSYDILGYRGSVL
ncbi:unnamed protein product [Boreogadus saida]